MLFIFLFIYSSINIFIYLFYCFGGKTLELVAQRGSQISLLGDAQYTLGHGSGKMAPGSPA